MDDRLALARATGVFDAEEYYRQQLHRINEQDRARRARVGNALAGVLLCCVLGIYVVLSFTMGAHA